MMRKIVGLVTRTETREREIAVEVPMDATPQDVQLALIETAPSEDFTDGKVLGDPIYTSGAVISDPMGELQKVMETHSGTIDAADALVHDLKSKEATEINNDTLSQLHFLLGAGWTAEKFREYLKEKGDEQAKEIEKMVERINVGDDFRIHALAMAQSSPPPVPEIKTLETDHLKLASFLVVEAGWNTDDLLDDWREKTS